MALPNDYPRGGGPGLVPGIVVGRGGKQDQFPDQTENGLKQVALITHNFPNTVGLEHLALSTQIKPLTAEDQCSYQGEPDYGTQVYGFHETGRNDCVILGGTNETFQTGGTPGNANLLDGFSSYFSKPDGRQRPPDFKEVMKNGAKIREIVEKGDWMHNLLQGLPTHGALSAISGIKMPEIDQIPTAVQKFNNILSAEAIQQIQSVAATLGQVLQKIASAASSGAMTANMPPEVKQAFTSMVNLMQSGNITETAGSLYANRVHPETFANNAVTLLSQATTISDLNAAMEQLLYDKSLHGLDQVPSITINVETAFGNDSIVITGTGNVTSQMSNTSNAARSTYSTSASSASSSPSAKPGQNMFGQSAGTMLQMAERMAPQMQKMVKQMTEKLNQSGDAQQLWGVITRTLGDKNKNIFNRN